MSKEKIGTLILVNSPQNSRGPDLPQIDLLSNPTFKNVVRHFDTALEVGKNESLSEANQFASVVMSVGAHSAFVHGLRERIQPGQVFPVESRFRLRIVGHSVGEMASLIEAGITDIETMAWILRERQRITEAPIVSGVRFMLAAVGVDVDKFDKGLNQLVKRTFGDSAQVVLANRNTPSRGVVSVQVSEGDPRTFAKRLTDASEEFRHPGSNRPPRFIHLDNIRNSFHSIMLKPEEMVLQHAIAQRYSQNNFRVNEGGIVYSPMLGKWIKSDKDAWTVVNQQLTRGVGFSKGVRRLAGEKGLAAFIAADIKDEITPQMLRENIGSAVPILNVKNEQSLKEAIDIVSELLKVV